MRKREMRSLSPEPERVMGVKKDYLTPGGNGEGEGGGGSRHTQEDTEPGMT